MKKLAVLSAMAVMGTFVLAPAASAGPLTDAFKSVFDKAKEAGKKLIARGKGTFKPFKEALNKKIEEWKARAKELDLKGKWKKTWGKIQKQYRSIRANLEGEAKKIRIATVKKWEKWREKVREFWKKIPKPAEAAPKAS